jgi:hypothetical protein
MKSYSKYALENQVWGVGLQYIEYDIESGEPFRQVEDYGNLMLYCEIAPGSRTERGTCHMAETTLNLASQYEEDQVFQVVFVAKWQQATRFFDKRLDLSQSYDLTPKDIAEIISKFNPAE